MHSTKEYALPHPVYDGSLKELSYYIQSPTLFPSPVQYLSKPIFGKLLQKLIPLHETATGDILFANQMIYFIASSASCPPPLILLYLELNFKVNP